MKWGVTAFWIFVFCGLLAFFYLYDPFLFCQQEEVQLFIPDWSSVRELLLKPGGVCSLAGLFITQFYSDILIAALINAVLYSFIGVLFYFLLQQIACRGYNLLLALIPVVYLLKTQLNPAFVIDGAIGVLFLLLFLYLSILVLKTKKSYLIPAIASILIYCILGQLVTLYGVLLVFLCYVTRKENWYYSIGSLFIGGLLSYVGARMALYIPLTDGIYSLRYQESQFTPESFLYFVWIRLSILLLLLFVIAYLLKEISLKRKVKEWLISGVVGLGVIGYSFFDLPDTFDLQNRMFGQLAYLKKQQDWKEIIHLSQEIRTPGSINLNYLNMALAKSGELADKMFLYDQKGAQSLIAPWNGTYYMSVLLSDIHYMIGDISVSESYAMEALTLAKRGGSPQILQRLVEINLMKGDNAVAGKYLGILRQMPFYRTWAEGYIKDISCTGEAYKSTKNTKSADLLLSSLDTETLWKAHLVNEPFNEMAFEYLGCSYLLAKELSKFYELLNNVSHQYNKEALPVHFQEAVLICTLENDASTSDFPPVQEKYISRFEAFRQDFKREASNLNGYAKMYQQYGDTYWFYYYCKQL